MDYLHCAIEVSTQSCIAVSTSESALAFYVREQQALGKYATVVTTLCNPTTFPDAYVVDPSKYGF